MACFYQQKQWKCLHASSKPLEALQLPLLLPLLEPCSYPMNKTGLDIYVMKDVWSNYPIALEASQPITRYVSEDILDWLASNKHPS